MELGSKRKMAIWSRSLVMIIRKGHRFVKSALRLVLLNKHKKFKKDHLCNKCIYVLELIVPVRARKVKAFPLLNSVQ